MTVIHQASFQIIQRQMLSEHEEQGILSLCFQAWGHDFAPLWPTFVDATHVLASVQGRLVSHALWVTRWLQPAHAAPLRTAYVEAVVTDPAYQRQGLASAVIQHLHAAIADFDLGGLSPSRVDFYQRLGWERWCGPLFIRTPSDLIATPDEQLMILRLPQSPALDLDAPMSAEWRDGELW